MNANGQQSDPPPSFPEGDPSDGPSGAPQPPVPDREPEDGQCLFDLMSPFQLLGFAVALLVGYQAISGLLWDTSPAGALGPGAAGLLGIVLPYALLVRRLGLPIGREFGLHRLSMPQFAGTLAFFAGLTPISYALANWNERLYPPPEDYMQYFEAIRPHSATSFVLGFVSFVLLVPLAEELLFRRLILGVLARHLTVTTAVVLVGLLFGAAHFMPWLFLPLSALGIGFGHLVARTRTLTAAWLAHALFNGISYVSLSVSGSSDTELGGEAATQPLMLVAAAILVVAGNRLLWAADPEDP